ncbi:hypothetical protein Ga0466249_002523 [Sporomusaceae bacterium BoRhaA]|uniref:DUF3870 domain-containing protein n=1 Tax=Pelorhabdus rhamnosifermentans TaxID=2772457 RepID=UPI001C05F230|nr:DUF3870 domain-containing protein [Pelorhabdus rhamnosifermentans]MBU2701407.1 hypothetical protein [Pelorhabdus rhamnosifermentans]
MFEKNTIYIVGNAKTQQNNPITLQYGQFFIGFVIDKETGLIIACDVSAIIQTTTEFVSSLFIGKSITADTEEIRQELETRYFASSQKAILVAFKDAQKKFWSIKEGKKIDLL